MKNKTLYDFFESDSLKRLKEEKRLPSVDIKNRYYTKV